MKSVKVLVVLLAFAPALAMASGRPAKIDCDIVGASEALPKKLTITKLDTANPESTFEDAELMDPVDEKDVANTGIMGLNFSNECDNMFSVEFFQTNLELLKSGKVKEITGSVNGGTSGEDPSTGTLICRVK